MVNKKGANNRANNKKAPAAQSKQAKAAVPEDEDEMEDFKVPGERVAELTKQQLASWTKTGNCRFYIAESNKWANYQLATGEQDTVCDCAL